MLKSMRRVAGKFVEVLTNRTFLMMAGWALVSSAVSYASLEPIVQPVGHHLEYKDEEQQHRPHRSVDRSRMCRNTQNGSGRSHRSAARNRSRTGHR